MEPEDGSPRSSGSQEPTRSSSLASASALAGMGFQFVVSILLFLYAGQWVDRKLGTKPLFLIIGVFAGASASFYSMYKRLNASSREDQSPPP